jgi:hypothetical protein
MVKQNGMGYGIADVGFVLSVVKIMMGRLW